MLPNSFEESLPQSNFLCKPLVEPAHDEQPGGLSRRNLR